MVLPYRIDCVLNNLQISRDFKIPRREIMMSELEALHLSADDPRLLTKPTYVSILHMRVDVCIQLVVFADGNYRDTILVLRFSPVAHLPAAASTVHIT